MTIHTCETCNYSTKYKQDLNKHLKTKKHRLNEEKTLENEKNITLKDTKKHKKDTKKHEKDTKKHYFCDYCNNSFNSYGSKRRHELHFCKENTDNYSDLLKQKDNELESLKKEMKNEMNKQRKEMEKQRKDLMRQIEVLLTKVGNNNTTITNNIQLNNYGNEDLSHITNNQKTQMLKMPYGMIPKMIESVHFDDNKPENRNIMIVNKKDKYIKIFKNGKWVYKDKKETLEDLIDGKYYILDEHYNEIPRSELNELQRNRYKEFQTKYDSNDNELHKKLIEKTEITLLNQME